jgi:hypothetical protein
LAAYKGNTTVISELVKVEGLVNVVSEDSDKDTALHICCRSGLLEGVRTLMSAGADATLLNGAGKRAKELAEINGHEEVSDYLSKGKEDGPADDVEVVKMENAAVPLQKLDRWGFVGTQELDAKEEEHKIKEIEREIKWVEMRNDWKKWSKRKKMRERCLKGIPDSMRSFAWVRLSGAKALREASEKKGENYYNDLVAREDETEALEVIKRDLKRTFPDHTQFQTQVGLQSLFRVLKAFSFHNPDIGYCQGMGFVAALFLMYCVEEQDAFWMLIRMVTHYGMGGFWDKGLSDVPKMCHVHTALLAEFCPQIYAHLEEQGINGALYAPSFYITGYTYSLPWPCVLRVWDAFLVDGMPVLHGAGVGLMHMHQDQILKLPFEKLMPFLRFNHIINNDDDGRGSSSGHISHVELSEELQKWLPKVKKQAVKLEKKFAAGQK